jgi:hypothetical protein
VLEDRLAPATLTVNSTADTANPTDTYLSLREAIAIFNSPTLPTNLSQQILAQISGTLHGGGMDSVVFDHDAVTSAITLSGTLLRLSLPSRTATVTIDGGSGVTVDANNRSQVFQVDSGVQASLDHLTISHGSAPRAISGGGILNNGGTLTVNSCTFTSNGSSGGGGGIYNAQGMLTVSNSAFLSNTGPFGGGGIANFAMATVTTSAFTSNSGGAGGGGAIYNSGTVDVSSCILSSNSGFSGGGIFSISGTLTVTHCTLSGNNAATGGGIEAGGTLTVSNSTFTSNTANTEGGGLYRTGIGPGTITGSTLSGNSTGNDGGGLENTGTLAVSNCTLSANSGSSAGGGITNQGSLTVTSSTLAGNSASAGGGLFNSSSATLLLQNSIVSGNSSTSAQGPNVNGAVMNTSGYNLVGIADGTLTGINDGVNGNQIGTTASPIDAQLGPLADNGGPTLTHALLLGSPAIGTGDPSLAGTPDQRGVTRHATPSIGAYEGPRLWRVTTLADSGAGSLRDNLAQAGNGDLVNFAAGLHGVITLTSGELQLHNGVTLFGPGANLLSVSGNNASRVFEVLAGSTAQLEGLTITGGNADQGGGIANHGTLTVTAVSVQGNSAGSSGGGAYNDGILTVTASTLSGNVAQGPGGGIANTGNLQVTNSTLSGNRGSRGAAISQSSGMLALNSSTLSGNTASVANAGINLGAPASLQNSIVAGNVLTDGSASDLGGGTVDAASAYNLIGTGGSGGLVNGVNHNLVGVADAHLGSLADNGGPTRTIALLSGSRAISAGDSSLSGSFDQRGQVRHHFPSIGAFEPLVTFLVANLADSGPDSLRADLGLALAGDTVAFADNVRGTITLITGELAVSANVTILGPGADLLSVSANQAAKIFHVLPGTSVSLSGLTLTGGSAASGVGIDNEGTLTVSTCTFNSSTPASWFGGIMNGGTLAVTDCIFDSLSAPAGAGIDNSYGMLTVSGSLFRGNLAVTPYIGGGAISNFQATATVLNSTFESNTAYGSGGALANVGGTLTVSDCTFDSNSALAQGGGLYNYLASTLTVSNSTLSANAANTGGALFNEGSPLLLQNTIVAGNQSTGSTGTGPDINGAVDSTSSYNLVGIGDSSLSGISNGVNNNQIGTSGSPLDPHLSPLGSYGGPTQTFALLPGSPALDAGDPAFLGTPDQRGVIRSGGVNIGAFQASAASFVVSAPDSVAAGVPFDVIVSAIDQYNQAAVGYTGTITFSSADPHGAILPADYTFTLADGGSHTFAGLTILYTAGIQDVTVTDAANGLTGSANVTVVAGSAVAFRVIGPSTAVSGTPFDVTVRAVDAYGNTDTNYTGTIRFTTTDPDPGVVLPPDYPFQPGEAGTVTFADGVTLVSPGEQTLTVTDLASGITGSTVVTL